MKLNLLSDLHALANSQQKAFAVLIDPDDTNLARMRRLIDIAEMHKVDYFLVGGSLVQDTQINKIVPFIKTRTNIPVILFPASMHQIVPEADAILFLSLISGRNPDLLIGKHVEAAPIIRESGLEVLPTGYMLIDCGSPTTASYMSHSFPIPYNKPSIAACTAMAGEMLGLRLMYLDGGSGASKTVSAKMIHLVKSKINVPLIVGGGIRSAQKAHDIWKAGADIIVIGNAIEKDPTGELIKEVASVRYSFGRIEENLRT